MTNGGGCLRRKFIALSKTPLTTMKQWFRKLSQSWYCTCYSFTTCVPFRLDHCQVAEG